MKNEVIIYQGKSGAIELKGDYTKETLWASQAQITEVFDVNRSVVTKHIRNILKNKELIEESVCAKFAHTAKDGKIYQVQYYNLDVILAVGYRANSLRAIQFRQWATKTLRQHILNGYTLNEKQLQKQAQKLQALQNAIHLIATVKSRKSLEYKEVAGLLDVISDYAYALDLLDEYDYKKLVINGTSKKETYKLTYEDSAKVINQIKAKFGGSALFGKQKDESFKSSVADIYQTFNGKELYPSVEEKAAHLLYFVVKNHSFVDGNKRIAASMFLWFLSQNNILYRKDGSKRMADNALVAVTLMIAESKPQEKDVMTTLVVNLINRNN